jgi:hypothetical protein
MTTSTWAQSNGIRTSQDWKRASREGRLPKGVPSHPEIVYVEKWKGWPQFLGFEVGAGRSAPEVILHAELTRFLPLDSVAHPIRIPGRSRPKQVDMRSTELRLIIEYDGARYHADELEKDRRETELLRNAGWRVIRVRESPLPIISSDDVSVPPRPQSFVLASAVIRHLLNIGVISVSRNAEVDAYRKAGRLASRPTDVVRSSTRPSFAEARQWARAQGCTTILEWFALAKTDRWRRDIPVSPDQCYRAEFTTWGDWLGTGKKRYGRGVWRPFADALAYVRSMGLRTVSEWKEAVRKPGFPADIPKHPWHPKGPYKGDWRGVQHWFGTPDGGWCRFEDARALARSSGCHSEAEWVAKAKGGRLPKNVPADPAEAYSRDGWAGWDDWFGIEATKLAAAA